MVESKNSLIFVYQNKAIMKSNYIDLELAKKLKELGFNEQCRAYYRILFCSTDGIFHEMERGATINYANVDETHTTFYLAPTVDEAFKWLTAKGMLDTPKFIHPEIKEGEIFLLNVKDAEVWNGHSACESVRRGTVAYSTTGEIVEGYKPLFGILKK